MTIEWVPTAESDFYGQFVHIAEKDPAAAVAVGDRIMAHIEHLNANPSMGKPGRRAGTRELVVPRTPFIVVYRLRDDDVQILRILHGSQSFT